MTEKTKKNIQITEPALPKGMKKITLVKVIREELLGPENLYAALKTEPNSEETHKMWYDACNFIAKEASSGEWVVGGMQSNYKEGLQAILDSNGTPLAEA